MRLCDGRYFPIQRHAGLSPAQACSSFCPASATKIYSGSTIEPNLLALNFMLHDSLGGGGTESLKTDAQGKTHAQGMLLLEIEVPDEIAARLPHREHRTHG